MAIAISELYAHDKRESATNAALPGIKCRTLNVCWGKVIYAVATIQNITSIAIGKGSTTYPRVVVPVSLSSVERGDYYEWGV